MIGIDITKLSRFKNKTDAFLKKVLHPNELVLYNQLNNDEKIKFLATRWVIKEAIFKANNQKSSFSKLNIVKNKLKYWLIDSDEIIDHRFQISTSNDGDFVVAVVYLIDRR